MIDEKEKKLIELLYKIETLKSEKLSLKAELTATTVELQQQKAKKSKQEETNYGVNISWIKFIRFTILYMQLKLKYKIRNGSNDFKVS